MFIGSTGQLLEIARGLLAAYPKFATVRGACPDVVAKHDPVRSDDNDIKDRGYFRDGACADAGKFGAIEHRWCTFDPSGGGGRRVRSRGRVVRWLRIVRRGKI